jgi:hypothetical protein
MKPFFRFSKEANCIFDPKHNIRYRHLFWDFDDSLQKILLGILKMIATPSEITQLCIDRWKINLKQLVENGNKKLIQTKESGIKPEFSSSPREEFVLTNINRTGQFLYIGCGTGTECLRYAQQGLSVIGIDTDLNLVKIANEWAHYLDVKFYPVYMDVMSVGFTPRNFDGFLLEFYGSLPSKDQILNLQEDLSRALKDFGKGFIVASRKGYGSAWYKLRNPYSTSMKNWLLNQPQLDFYFSERDGSEERLIYGMYQTCHTVESLTYELSYAFDVLHCSYEEFDPRYVVALVNPRKKFDRSIISKGWFENYTKLIQPFRLKDLDLEDFLSKIDLVCTLLESHEKRVMQFFDDRHNFSNGNPLKMNTPELQVFIDQLQEILNPVII